MQALRPFIGSVYIPGMGILIGVLSIVFLGFIVSQGFMERLLSFVEVPFNNVPIVKSIYSAIKSFSDYFSTNVDAPARNVVVVKFPGENVELIGFITNTTLSDLPDGVSKDDRVAVYLPMGYMIGGYTIFVPRSWTKNLDIGVEEAMKQTLVAWMPQKRDSKYRPYPPSGPS